MVGALGPYNSLDIGDFTVPTLYFLYLQYSSLSEIPIKYTIYDVSRKPYQKIL